MHTLVLLIFMLFVPNAEPQLLVRVEPSIEQCQKDGQAVYDAASAAITDMKLTSAAGSCKVIDLDDATHDKRGSV